MHQTYHMQKKISWYWRIQHSWVVNALIIPIVIALLCGLIISWIR